MIGQKSGQTPIFYFPVSKREKLERKIQYFLMPWLHNNKPLLLQITCDYLPVRLVIFIGSQNLQSTAGRAPGRFYNYLSPFMLKGNYLFMTFADFRYIGYGKYILRIVFIRNALQNCELSLIHISEPTRLGMIS